MTVDMEISQLRRSLKLARDSVIAAEATGMSTQQILPLREEAHKIWCKLEALEPSVRKADNEIGPK